MEEWKDVIGYEGMYKVSSMGLIKSVERVVQQVNHGTTKCFKYKSKVLHQEITNRGYLRITLSKDNIQQRYSVHRIVATAFLENPENFSQVNHKDGNPLNNSAENLEWCSQSMNQKHAFDTGLQMPVKGEQHGNCKLVDTEVAEIINLYATGLYTQKQIAIMYGISRQHVSDLTLLKKRL